MSEHMRSYENLERYLWVHEMNSEKLAEVRAKIRRGLSLAFLVTSNFEIYIGTTGMHADIYRNFPDRSIIIEKDKIMGGTKKISYEVSDSHKNGDLSSEELGKLHAAIGEKVNEFLDLDFYLKSV
jgi:hypothetical protein